MSDIDLWARRDFGKSPHQASAQPLDVLGVAGINDSPELTYNDKAETRAWLGLFQSPTGGYVSRRQRYGSSTKA